jgi:hypothetical protein
MRPDQYLARAAALRAAGNEELAQQFDNLFKLRTGVWRVICDSNNYHRGDKRMRKIGLAAIICMTCITGLASATVRPAHLVVENQSHKIEYVCRGDQCWWRGRRHARGLNEVGCPYGYTVQDGVCKPYRGPYAPNYYGGSGYLPCGRPGWTVQDGVCKPYRGY